jgi:O-antigen/teichoic acid export membrane protein
MIGGRRARSLADQALVSFGNLAAFLIYARHLTTEDWAIFGYAYVAAMFAQGFQRATISIPLIAYSSESWARDRSQWVAQNALATAIAIVAMVGAATLTNTFSAEWITLSFAAAALILGPMFLFEFCRRSAIQEGQFALLPYMSVAYAISGIAVATLGVFGHATKWLPAIGTALACTSAVVVYYIFSRKPILQPPKPWEPAADYVKFATWSSLSHLAFSGYFFGIQTVLAALADSNAVGIYFALRIFTQPVNTLVSAMDSVDKPRAAIALSSTGRGAMNRILNRSLVVMLCVAAPYLLTLVLFGDQLAHFLLGPKYADQKSVLWAWSVVACLMLLVQPVETGLYVLRRSSQLFLNRVVASAVGLTSAFLFIPGWGATGALMAMALALVSTWLLGRWSLGRPD